MLIWVVLLTITCSSHFIRKILREVFLKFAISDLLIVKKYISPAVFCDIFTASILNFARVGVKKLEFHI